MEASDLGCTADVPKDVLDYPSMMTHEEKALLYHLARDHYAGQGVIVDAGLFLGASTKALGSGLTAAGKGAPGCIQAYDIAIWNKAGFDKYLSDPAVLAKIGTTRYQDGETYRPLLEALLSEYEDLVDLRIGDIVKEVRGDQPVEIAFYDLLKDYDRDWAVFKALGPRYIPGRTVVIQQDYFFEDAQDSRIRQEFLSPFFRFVGGFGTSGVFLLEKPLPGSYFRADPVKRLSISEKVILLQQASERISPSKYRLYAALAVVKFLIQNAMKDQARTEPVRVERAMFGGRHTSPRAQQIADRLKAML